MKTENLNLKKASESAINDSTTRREKEFSNHKNFPVTLHVGPTKINGQDYRRLHLEDIQKVHYQLLTNNLSQDSVWILDAIISWFINKR